MTDTTITPDALDVVLSKIERLWRKANDPAATVHEREAFEAKALSLMERHRIDAAMLDLDPNDVLDDHLFGKIAGRYATVETQLLTNVAHAYSCRTWWRSYGTTKEVYVFGYKSDAEKVIRLTKMLVIDAQAQAARLTGYSAGETFSLRRGFILGYASEIGFRFREAAKIARTEARAQYGTASEGAELVLVERKTQVEQAMSARRFRKANSIAAANSRGHAAGRQAGASADLSGGSRRVGGSTKALGR